MQDINKSTIERYWEVMYALSNDVKMADVAYKMGTAAILYF